MILLLAFCAWVDCSDLRDRDGRRPGPGKAGGGGGCAEDANEASENCRGRDEERGVGCMRTGVEAERAATEYAGDAGRSGKR